jgi:hypothetical protein
MRELRWARRLVAATSAAVAGASIASAEPAKPKPVTVDELKARVRSDPAEVLAELGLSDAEIGRVAIGLVGWWATSLASSRTGQARDPVWYCAGYRPPGETTWRNVCERARDKCEMLTQGLHADPCLPQKRVACFGVVWRLTGPDEWCQPDFTACNAMKTEFARAKAADIVSQTECAAK